jgi:serine/threonine protein kinase
MPPEILSGSKYSFYTDIWSLGIVFYELLALTLPFQGSCSQCARLIEAEDPPLIAHHYSAELKKLVSDMLVKDQFQRITLSAILKLPFIQMIESHFSLQVKSISVNSEIKSPQEHFNLAQKFLQSNNFQEAENHFILSIQNDFVEAMRVFGIALRDGKFGNQRKLESEEYFLMAIDKGDVVALCDYAIGLKNGIYGQNKIPLSEEYYLKAIEKGDVVALCGYAIGLHQGIYGQNKIPLSEEYF